MAGTFSLDVDKWIAKAKGKQDLVVRKVSLDIFRRVILRTPVRSGRARGNWQCAINNIPVGEIETVDTNGATTLEAVADAIKDAKAGDVIYLVNNVPYILKLENGSSKQAPAGMVGITLTEFGAVVDQAAKE